MTYCFRIRFRLGNHVKLDTDDSELALANEAEHGETVVLKPRDQEHSLGDARQLVLRGMAYDSEAAARSAAARWRGLLEVAFARLNIGADFGDRAPRSFFTKYGLHMLSQDKGGAVLNDVHGIAVFECDPSPLFVTQEATAVVGKPVGRLQSAVEAARQVDATMTPQRQLAYDLYSGSFFQPSADARLVMLAMALETLISQEQRSDAVARLVERLITITKGSGLPEGEINSIVGTLQGLFKESVGQAGRRLVHSLGSRRYMDEAPAKFFDRCYKMRSALVHGHYPRPSPAEVGPRAANLEVFVSHLLSGELLELVPEWQHTGLSETPPSSS